MKNDYIKYITLNDSRAVASSTLNFGLTSISLKDFDFAEFSESQRKVIFGWVGFGQNKDYGATYKSTILSRKKIELEIFADCEEVTISLRSKTISLDICALSAGKYCLELTVFLDRPLEALVDVPDKIKPLLQYSQIVNVTAALTAIGGNESEKSIYKGPIYDGAGQLGFFLADLGRMDEFLKNNGFSEVVDLQKAFCETEIANQLFDAGILILVWGMTPWHYYIYGLAKATHELLIPCAEKPQYRGRYRIGNDMRKLSVVPGEQLLNWPSCLKQEWPEIDLLGDGEAVQLNVHLRAFDPIDGEVGPALAVVSLYRINADPVVDPLLLVDIEGVEIDPGY